MFKTKVKSTEECAALFEIEVHKETIGKAFDEVYGELSRIANIPGFRVGKAPIDMVKRHYAKDAKEEVLKRLIPEAYRKALEEHKINPVSLPEIMEVNFDENKSLSFKARVDTRPKFKLKNYKGLKIEKKKVNITEEDVEKTIQNLRELSAKYIDAGDRPIRMGDCAISDLDCMLDGKPVHKRRENLWIYVEKDSPIPDLPEKMIGMVKGEEKDIEAKLSDKYPDKNLAGKLATYHVKVKEIKIRELPEVNDEFAKGIGKDNMEEVKAEIRKELNARAAESSSIDAENKLLKKLTDDNLFGVPSGFVARQIEYMVEDAKRRLQEKGFKPEELDKKDAEFKERFKEDAIRRVRLLFILDEIARTEGIEVSDKDVDEAYASIAVRAGKSEEEVRAHYEKEDLVETLRDELKENKTIKFINDNAVITEV